MRRCSAWEFAGRELAAAWDSKGARVIAGDIQVNAARQIKALRGLGAGLQRAGSTEAGPGRARLPTPPRAPPRVAEDDRWALPRGRSREPCLKEAKEEASADDELEEEGEPVDTSPERDGPDRRGDGHRRQPEPDRLPRTSGADHHRASRGADKRRASPRRGEKRSGREHRGLHKKRRTGRHRGGRKHQRLSRLAQDPNRLVHRKPGHEFWAVSSLRGDPIPRPWKVEMGTYAEVRRGRLGALQPVAGDVIEVHFDTTDLAAGRLRDRGQHSSWDPFSNEPLRPSPQGP